jgi:hypothetical protein
MKSRKKVSHKKAAPHKTRSRRSHSRIRSKRQTKRGGMFGAKPISMIQRLRTFMIHEIRPLVSPELITYTTGYDPKPSDHSVTKANERFYRSFVDIPPDSSIKVSIKDLYKELKDPVKNADKMNTIKKKYDEIIKMLDEEEKKQQAEQSRQAAMNAMGKQFTPPTPVLSATVVGSSSTPNSKSARSSAISSLVNPPFSTPRQPDYSTNKPEPDTLPSKGEIRPPGQSLGEGTPPRNPFDKGEPPINSPYFSPPPPNQSGNQENQNPLLLSPDPALVKILNFNV